MVESTIRPNDITFISILCACIKSGMVAEGLEYFNSMKYEYFIMPNLNPYACVVDLLGHSKKLEETYELIRTMPRNPDLAVCGALLNACRIQLATTWKQRFERITKNLKVTRVIPTPL